MTNLDIFLSQNPITAAGLASTLEAESVVDTEDAEGFAQHHAGGLYVLIRDLGDGRYVKMHDSWGDDENIVVHVYNNDDADDPDEQEHYFSNAHNAFCAFAWTEFDEVTLMDDDGDLWTWRYYDLPDNPALFALVPYDEDACWNVPADTPRTPENLAAAVAAFHAKYGSAS